MQQRTAEVPRPHSEAETVAVVGSAPRERVQNRAAEQIETFLSLGKGPSQWWDWSRMNECNSGALNIRKSATTNCRKSWKYRRRQAKTGVCSVQWSSPSWIVQAEKLRSVVISCGGIGVGCVLRSVCSPRSTKLLVLGSGEGSTELVERRRGWFGV